MRRHSYTKVPNTLIDIYLHQLGYAELKILLVVIRQTYGWRDIKNGGSKEWDWISNQFFVRKTGLSRRAVSDGIAKLQSKNLIRIKNQDGTLIHTALQRKHSSKLFFACALDRGSSANTALNRGKYLHSTIVKHTKEYREVTSQGFKKITFKNLPKSVKRNDINRVSTQREA